MEELESNDLQFENYDATVYLQVKSDAKMNEKVVDLKVKSDAKMNEKVVDLTVESGDKGLIDLVENGDSKFGELNFSLYFST